MTKMETTTTKTPPLTAEAFALLGGGQIAYVKSMRSEDVSRIFPGAPEIEPGLQIFALLAADGSPILLTDSKATAIANAREHDLTPVSIH